MASLSSHLSDCGYVPESCQYCGAQQERRKLLLHEQSCECRPRPCKHCSLPFQQIQLEEHEAQCPSRRESCPNGCGEMVIVSEVEAHRMSSCPQEPTRCPYTEFGCNFQCPRSLMGHHMQQQPHEHLQLVTVCMSDAFQKQDLVIAQLRQQIQDKEGQIHSLSDEVQSLVQLVKVLQQQQQQEQRQKQQEEREQQVQLVNSVLGGSMMSSASAMGAANAAGGAGGSRTQFSNVTDAERFFRAARSPPRGRPCSSDSDDGHHHQSEASAAQSLLLLQHRHHSPHKHFGHHSASSRPLSGSRPISPHMTAPLSRVLLKKRHTSSRGCSSSPTSTSSSSPASSPNSCLSYSPPGHHQLSSATRGVRGAFSPARSGSTTIPSSNVHLSWSADYGCNLHYKNNMQTLKNCNWPGGTSICTGLKIEVPDPSQGSGSLSSTPPIRFHIKATSRGVLWSTALGISTLQRFTAGMWCGKSQKSYGYWSNGKIWQSLADVGFEDTESHSMGVSEWRRPPSVQSAIQSSQAGGASSQVEDVEEGEEEEGIILQRVECFHGGDVVGLEIFPQQQRLHFVKNGRHIGEAVLLQPGTYYPCVSTAWADVSIVAHS